MTKLQIDTSDQKIRNFGILFFVVFAALAGLSFYKGHSTWPWFAGASLVFLLAGFIAKPALRPIYFGWMAFAFVLGWINTRIILGIFFYGILFPVGLLLKILRRDPLARRLDRQTTSYWIRHEPVPFDRQKYERPF